MEKTPLKDVPSSPDTPPSWSSPIPENRWKGYREIHPGIEAFKSLETFEQAQQNELEECLDDHEKSTLGRLLKRGKKNEIEVFIRSHGANPIIDPQAKINVKLGVAKADVVDLEQPPSTEAVNSILNGEVVHMLFQAGEASRFKQGPLYNLNPLSAVDVFKGEVDFSEYLDRIEKAKLKVPKPVAEALLNWPLGVKQPIMIRASLRRMISEEISLGRISVKDASGIYQKSLKNQKVLFLVSQRPEVLEAHEKNLREKFNFFGFNPSNMVTVAQQLVHGLTADDSGKITLINEDWAQDAAGHMYALLQTARPEDFSSYTENGRTVKSREIGGLGYLFNRGGQVLSIIRINDMDRQTTEILNPRAVSYALKMFSKGYVNAIEGVANSQGQKGGTGTTFDDPEIHVLTETHENSFPELSRAFEGAMKEYLETNAGRHPAYNAMRQLADLQETRRLVKKYGGRIVFVPRQKEINGEMVSYLGVDMPMGDLSLLYDQYKSRMFQFAGPGGKELLIHDMKTKDNLHFALTTIERQLQDPHIMAAVEELISGNYLPFSKGEKYPFPYGAPTPEFDSTN